MFVHIILVLFTFLGVFPIVAETFVVLFFVISISSAFIFDACEVLSTRTRQCSSGCAMITRVSILWYRTANVDCVYFSFLLDEVTRYAQTALFVTTSRVVTLSIQEIQSFFYYRQGNSTIFCCCRLESSPQTASALLACFSTFSL